MRPAATPQDAETQPDRTALSWQRTGLGVLAVAALLGHGAVRSDHPALLVVAGCIALIGLGVLGVLAPARRQQLARVPPAAAPAFVAAVTAAVVLVALAAVGAALTLP